MPRRNDLSTIVIVGSGPIVIGQASEFDYSGVQACKALRAEGYRVVLVNPNPATIMTDPDLADATYVEPVTPEYVERVIAVEQAGDSGPDGMALLPTLGGQTGLNVAVDLAEAGVLDRYGVELIGASPETIAVAEDRQRFGHAMADIGLDVASATTVTREQDAHAFAEEVGFPILVRASYTLGGDGSGLARGPESFLSLVRAGLAASPIGQVQLDESLLGWKEYELEVMRDADDSCVVVCSIENVDAMGVHTGDSVTVAPAMTLTDVEYQTMRDGAFAVLRRIGVETGGSNVQFAVDPATGRQIVVECNPRVSRSSALASKATGFPIAKIAALLAVGYRLHEITNDITRETPAAFEPSIDYVVTKIPRFAFEKFPGVDDALTTRMKSVGEVMAIGTTFTESLGKALTSLEDGTIGLLGRPTGYVPPAQSSGGERSGGEHRGEAGAADAVAGARVDDVAPLRDRALADALATPHARRLLDADAALARGWSPEAVTELTGYDPWFVDQLAQVVEVRQEVRGRETLPNVDDALLRRAKRHGLSDAVLAEVLGAGEGEIRARRHRSGIRAVFRTVDTCAGEFPAFTPYHYSTYGDEDEVEPSDRPRVIILGSGPNRIGQGIEFDACCVQAVFALRDAGYETVMINCNPETVSTDYDTADRLYFEPLTLEHVLGVYEAELAAVGGDRSKVGVLVQLGGQTPLKLAHDLESAGVPILGTPPDAIDLAEDRGRFGAVLAELGIDQAAGEVAASPDGARDVAARIGFPVLVRPSYVLGGQSMAIVYSDEQLSAWLATHAGAGAVLVDDFLEGAVEVDVDAVADGDELYVGGILEHIEEAGVHSGDSACVTPPFTLGPSQVRRISEATALIAHRLGTRGLINIQFALRDDALYCIEANPRASRTVPFSSKATGVPLARIAARVMAGERLADLRAEGLLPAADAVADPLAGHVAVKEAVLPFNRFPGVDTRLGPEMRSTGEVMGIDTDFGAAFAKSQAGTGAMVLPTSGTVFVSVASRDKRAMIFPVKRLAELKFRVLATEGTAAVLRRVGVPCEVVGKVSEAGPGERSIVERIEAGEVDLVLNTPEGQAPRTDGYRIRTAAVAHGVPSITTLSGILAAIQGIEALREDRIAVRSLQAYHGRRPEGADGPGGAGTDRAGGDRAGGHGADGGPAHYATPTEGSATRVTS